VNPPQTFSSACHGRGFARPCGLQDTSDFTHAIRSPYVFFDCRTIKVLL
jgi:hypothetical protein